LRQSKNWTPIDRKIGKAAQIEGGAGRGKNGSETFGVTARG